MIALLQRVTDARVDVNGETVGEIGRGLLVLVAVHRDDGERDVARLAERILSYRVFPDDEGRMNRSVADTGGALLLVPQFTLAADTRKGTRASFTRAAAPDKGEAYFRQLVGLCRERLDTVETGRFGADGLQAASRRTAEPHHRYRAGGRGRFRIGPRAAPVGGLCRGARRSETRPNHVFFRADHGSPHGRSSRE